MTDTLTSKQRSSNMARIRSRDTKPEVLVRQALTAAGYRYRLHRVDLPGRPDIVFPGLRLAVLVHGCFWHGHVCREAKRPLSNKSYWVPKIAGNMARDRRNYRRLAALGWRRFVIRECTLDAGIRRLLRRLESLAMIRQ